MTVFFIIELVWVMAFGSAVVWEIYEDYHNDPFFKY